MIAGIIIIAVVFSGYFGIKAMTGKKTETKYVVSTAAKGNLITTVSATGQVATSNEVSMTSKASGTITYVGATSGEDVAAGKLLFKIDDTDARQAVKDAQASLDLAELSLEKLQEPVDELTLLQAEDALTSAQQSKQTATDNLSKSYDDGFTDVANAFLDLPSVMTGLNNVLFGNDFSKVQDNENYYASSVKSYDDAATKYQTDAYNKYQAARTAYNKAFSDYKAASRYSSTDTIEALISETYDTTKTISEAVKSANNLIQFYEDKLTEHGITYNSTADTHLSSLNGYTSKTNNHLSTLLSQEQTIANYKQAITDAARSITEKELSLENTKEGATEIELKTQQLAVEQKKNALADAQSALDDYYVYAPFAGTVASVDVKKGDTASSGTALATFISKGRLVKVSLNEIDVPNVKVGDDATLTFDALSDVSLVGKVSEIDTVGTVSSGVVYYDAEISFDDTTGQVNPGMSASASIITESKEDALLVPNAAVKSASDGTYYVEVPSTSVATASLNNSKGVALKSSITKKTVTIGSANDTSTEITSGLSEGEQLIVSTVSGSAASSSTKSSTKTTTTKTTTSTLTGGGMGGGPAGGF